MSEYDRLKAQKEVIERDLLVSGRAFTKDGKRVDPKDVYVASPSQSGREIAERIVARWRVQEWADPHHNKNNDLVDAIASAIDQARAEARAKVNRYAADNTHLADVARDLQSRLNTAMKALREIAGEGPSIYPEGGLRARQALASIEGDGSTNASSSVRPPV